MAVFTFTTFDDPLASKNGTVAFDINNTGQIVGQYATGNGTGHGFLLSRGTYTTIDDPLATGSIGTSAEGINASGQIVG